MAGPELVEREAAGSVLRSMVCVYTIGQLKELHSKGRGSEGNEMASRKAQKKSEAFETTEKVMQTFRIPRELVGRLRAEADRRGLDLTAYVIRVMGGVTGDFGLPEVARVILDDDRSALGMDREAYLLHLLFQRSLAVREEGPGFDGPRSRKKGR